MTTCNAILIPACQWAEYIHAEDLIKVMQTTDAVGAKLIETTNGFLITTTSKQASDNLIGRIKKTNFCSKRALTTILKTLTIVTLSTIVLSAVLPVVIKKIIETIIISLAISLILHFLLENRKT